MGFVHPPIVDTDYQGEIIFNIAGVPSGGKVRLEKFLDLDGDGVIDAGDTLIQSLELTDGNATYIGGVRNTSVPGDEDGAADGKIQARYLFRAQSEINRGAAKWIYRAVRVDNNATLEQASFTVTQPNLGQAITGKVTSNGKVNGKDKAHKDNKLPRHHKVTLIIIPKVLVVRAQVVTSKRITI